MPRAIILCSGIFLISTTSLSGQNLPKNPTPQQVVGYRITEQQRWNADQLPKNSVLYKTGRKYPGSQSFQFHFKKQQQPVIDLSSIRWVSLPADDLMNGSSSQQLSFLKKNLFQKKRLYQQWQKQNRLKDVQGGMLLRDFFIKSGNNSLHL